MKNYQQMRYSTGPKGSDPAYAHTGDAGLDLAVTQTHTFTSDDRWFMFHTDLWFAIPEGCVGLVAPRSSMAKKGLTFLNSPGIVDSNYRGEILIQTFWHGNQEDEILTINAGDRVGQLVVMPYIHCELVAVDNVATENTNRGTGGWGSTGS